MAAPTNPRNGNQRSRPNHRKQTNGGEDLCFGPRNFFPIDAPSMGRFQLLNLGGLGYGLEIRFWVVITMIVSLTLTTTLITTLTII